MIPWTGPITRVLRLQPVDALDPIATPEPADCPIWDALTAEHAAKTPRRDARTGRFVGRGRS